MNKTLIRSIREDGAFPIEWSWYDKNGRRYKYLCLLVHVHSSDIVNREIEKDNKSGFMAYAVANGFDIIDNYEGEHPKRLE